MTPPAISPTGGWIGTTIIIIIFLAALILFGLLLLKPSVRKALLEGYALHQQRVLVVSRVGGGVRSNSSSSAAGLVMVNRSNRLVGGRADEPP